MGYIFPMVISSEIRMGHYRDDDDRDDDDPTLVPTEEKQLRISITFIVNTVTWKNASLEGTWSYLKVPPCKNYKP